MNVYDQVKDKLYSENFNLDTLDGQLYKPYRILYSSGTVDKVIDMRAAIKDLSKAVELYDNAENYNERGKLYKEVELNDKAITDFNKAIELQNDRAEFYHERALLFKDIGRTEYALKDFNKAIELEKNPIFYANRAYLKREHLNDEQGAIEDLKEAKKLGMRIDDL